MSKGRRFDGEPKLNTKKVFAVIIAIAVIVMFVFAFKKLMSPTTQVDTKVVALKYFPVYTNNKWGVIDSKGSIIIEPTYDEMIVIPDNSKAVFICTYDVDYNSNTYKTKVLNEKNQEIFTGYEEIEAIENYDSNNTLWYEKEVLKVKQNGLYGLINLKGRQLVNCEYSSITALKGVTNSLVTVKDNKKGIIDNNGSIVLDNEYKDIIPISDKYENGYIVTSSQNDKYGVMNWNKTVALDTKYDAIKSIYGAGEYYVVKENGKWEIVDTLGSKYFEGEFEDIVSIDSKYAVVKKEGKYGIASIEDKKLVVEPKYQDMVFASGENYIVKSDEKYGIIDVNGNSLIEPKYKELVYRATVNFYEGKNEDYSQDLIDSKNMEVKLTGIISMIDEENGYMKVRIGDEYKYYNFKFEEKEVKEILKGNTIFLAKQNGKYGFVNREGIVVVDYIYDDATEQNDYGYASVKKDGVWGTINSKGEVEVEPKYKLDQNTLIEFIGKWHLGEDLNLYYFTDK